MMVKTPAPGKDFHARPPFFLAAMAVLLAGLIPVLARAEVPVLGKDVPFPDTPYAWRYEGPDYDARSNGQNAAARMRVMARERGDPNWLNIPLDPVIAIVERASGRLVARYRLEGGSFCDHEDDNCQMDGIFAITISSMEDEPVLGVVRHIGAHGQKLSILRPLKNHEKPVFEVAADFALSLRLRPDGLDVTIDRVLDGGVARQEQRHWPTVPNVVRAERPEIILPPAPPLSRSAAAFEARLRDIAFARDLTGFMALLSDDVLVSFGGNGGQTEFVEFWQLQSEPGRAHFWATLERLLAAGSWNEVGREVADDAGHPQRLTWPWVFTAWPNDAQDENAFDIFIASEDTALRAAPDTAAPVLARLPHAAVLHGRAQERDEPPGESAQGWLEVVAPNNMLGFVRREEVTPLLGTRIIANETETGWKIEAFVAGD